MEDVKTLGVGIRGEAFTSALAGPEVRNQQSHVKVADFPENGAMGGGRAGPYTTPRGCEAMSAHWHRVTLKCQRLA